MNWTDEDEYDTDREVAGIVYYVAHTYGTDDEGKGMARTEAYFQRLKGRYARAMKIKVGSFKGHWACFVSRAEKGY
jgi:hypothetical protein